MRLVVGLGNPGRAYEKNRHNIGFMVVDALCEKAGFPAFREKFLGLSTRGDLGDKPVMLLKPMTYMNLSGQSVERAIAFSKIDPSEMTVIHDELDLAFGDVRVKFGGGHAGHNGLRSITQQLGTSDFARVRMGIGRPPPGFRGEIADYVLANFNAEENAELSDLLARGEDAVRRIVADGHQAAMNVVNASRKR